MSDDQTRVDLGGGMVVPLRELIDDDGFDYDDLSENDEDSDCTICGGEGYDDCADPIQCFAPHTDGGLCPCIGCGGSGLARDQRIW